MKKVVEKLYGSEGIHNSKETMSARHYICSHMNLRDCGSMHSMASQVQARLCSSTELERMVMNSYPTYESILSRYLHAKELV